MIANKLSTIASALILINCLSQQQLLAASLGPYDYTADESSVTINYYQTSLGGGATEVSIPSTIEGKPVTAIGPNAFNSCDEITRISVPSTVTSIGQNAFNLCKKLAEINIPEGVKSIEDYTFDGCRDLTGITLPAGLSRIGIRAFSSCSSLTAITIPNKVTEFGDGAFLGCGIKAIDIPPSVKILGNSVFSSSNLQSITIPPTVEKIGHTLFFYCLNLTQVNLPSNFTRISEGMFGTCIHLTRIHIPSSVTTIEKRAFYFCYGLTTVTLPKNLRGIGINAFAKCPSLESAIFTSPAPAMTANVFDDSASDFRIFVTGDTKGYTLPRWHGYRISLPKEEIAVQSEDGSSLSTGAESKFGGILLGNSSAPQRFVIRNVGARRLTGLYAKTSSGNSSDFVVKTLGKSSLAPGKTAVLEISFTPKKKGKRVSQLRIFSSDGDEDPFEIEISGKGLQLLK